MVKNGNKKMVKIVKNGGPDLLRARRTGLSARRAQRTKSRGPKGLQLEVAALYTSVFYTSAMSLSSEKLCIDKCDRLLRPYMNKDFSEGHVPSLSVVL